MLRAFEEKLWIPEEVDISNGKIDLIVHLHLGGGIGPKIAQMKLGAVFNFSIHDESGSSHGKSNQYGPPFRDNPEKFGSMLERILTNCRYHLASPDLSIGRLAVSSFSAGYASLREILQVDEYYSRIETIIASDTIYADFARDGLRMPDPDQMKAFTRFATDAAKGLKTFVATCYPYRTKSYAGTADCLEFLIRKCGGEWKNSEEEIESLAVEKSHHDEGLHLYHFAKDGASHMSLDRVIPQLLKKHFRVSTRG